MNPRKKIRLYVQLGRAGDILNVLPLLKRDFDETGNRPGILVASAFAELLDGVTYLVPFLFDGAFEDSIGAYRHAESIAAQNDLEIVCTQIYGNEIHCGEKSSSFVRESWARVPDAPAWGSLPLVFDRRDLPREKGVKNHLLQRATGKPYVVLALSGTSSPFEENVDLARYLRNKLGKGFDFVDVSGFMAPRFYDLLTLLEGAHALVTIDSALLHLAAAVPTLPVVAFITRFPSPWHGTAHRPQQIARFFYDEAPECFAGVAEWVEGARDVVPGPRFLHAWVPPFVPDGGLDAATERRLGFARGTWLEERRLGGADWIDRAVRPEDLKRSSIDVGDSRAVPFVADVIDEAINIGARGDEIVALTNADVCMTPGLTGQVLDRVRRNGAAFTHRWDFYRPLERAFAHEEDVQRGEWYPGSDAFFFTVAWWRRHRYEYPDMIFGREQWDEVFRQLVKRHGGLEVPAAIYHEAHDSFWKDPEQRRTNEANVHNRRLARKWFLQKGYGPNDPDWWRLPSRPW